MATILIVDDRPTNREVLVVLLGYRGHRLLEATDGAEALALVHSSHPDLAIVDILMPTMDGFEFVRQLREDATIADTRVIFYTAHYLDQEAHALASTCGVSAVLTKPCEPEEVLSTVDIVLGITPLMPTPPPAAFDRENLQVLNEILSRKADDLRRTNERLTTLIEHCLQLGSERASEPLLRGFCDAAREIIGARYTVMGLVSEERGHHLVTSGMDVSLVARLTQPDPKRGVIQVTIGESRSLQLINPDGDPVALGLPTTFPQIHSWLSVPVLSSSRVYGWMGLIDKIGADAFTDEDERLACLLAAQVGRVYENGHLYGVLLSHTARLEREIADRNRAEIALRQSEERFRGAFEHTNVAMVLTNADHRFVRVNAAFTHLFGYTQSELLQMLLVDIMHPDDISESFACREALLAGESDYFQMEERYIHKTGHIIWGLTNVSIVRDTGGLPLLYVGQVQDITRRKHAEEALRAAQQRLESIVFSSPSVLFTLSYETFAPTWVSANIREMTGFSVEETLRQNGWGEQIHPEDLKHVQDGNNDLLARGHIGREYRLRQREGSYRWLREELRLLREVGGEPIEIVGSWLDITEHRHLQDQLRQVQKMEVVGRLAGGVAHDFNNILTVIVGYSELLASNLRQDDPLHSFTQEIRKAGHHGASLTRKLLAFSRKQVLVPVVLDPNILLREMEKMLHRLIGENITLEFIAHPGVWAIAVDPGQMEQVIVNLVVNARDAMPQGGKLRIEISNVELNETDARTDPEIRVGEYVSIAVEDTGTGMDETTQARIFEPFFTTKAPDKGTGLGLAVVHGFIRQSGGQVDVSSESGIGSTFKLYLPRSKGEIQPSKFASGTIEPRRGSETILLVEDEDGVRAFVRVVLERSGYTVLEADSSDTVLHFCQHYPEIIHVMVVDMVIPNMSGWQLAERVISLRPGIKVLYLSGYNQDALHDQGILGLETPYLQKPFTPNALATKVQEILQTN